jgi:hypothetical protein
MVKNATKQGLKSVKDPAESEKNFESLKNKSSEEVLKLRR